uniref:Uncharacterized protein n=1 Tax=Phyllymenia taiwanensis TaxID=1260292 RepID=R9XZD0_9FLOR|nr:hypothetical protein [Grateloupia taiwanensis]AGO19788.1 hypothetical protein [Grateloupia taiwanensis]
MGSSLICVVVLIIVIYQLQKLIGSQDLNCCTSEQNLQHD